MVEGGKAAGLFRIFKCKGMQDMRNRLPVLSLFFAFSLASGQPGARPALTPNVAPHAEASAQEAARGIEKKDIRAMIVYPEGVYGPDDVARFEASAKELADAIASGAKLTKADAARMSQGATFGERVRQQLAQSKGVVFVALNAAPSSAGNRPIQCPPQGCGCKEDGTGTEECDCRVHGNFCYCLLCLPSFPKINGVIPGAGIVSAAWRTAGGPEGVLVILAAPSDTKAAERRKLAETAIQTLNQEPWPARITIKTKSSPRVLEH